MKYTKGKWRMCSFAGGHVENEDGRLVAACMGYSTNSDNGEHRKENIANAKLIIKAPEMYEALKWLIENQNVDNLTISSTAMNANYEDTVINEKLLEIESLLKELKS